MFANLAHAWDDLTARGAPFEIGRVEIGGIDCPGYVKSPANLRELWVDAATRFADRTYLVFGEERLTYSDAYFQTQRIAAWLESQGVTKGDRIAIAMRNYPEWMLIYWAGTMIGATVCGLNAWWSVGEMTEALSIIQPRIVFADAERLERAPRADGGAGAVTFVAIRSTTPSGEFTWDDVVRFDGAPAAVPLDADDAACIFFTSGTTGASKAAVLTHRGCVTNVLNILFAGQVQAMATNASGQDLGSPVALVTTPLFHVTANNCCAQVAAIIGGTIILMYKWDPGAAIDLIEREGVTTISGTPVMHREIVLHPRFHAADLSRLAAFSGGGASLPPDILARIEGSGLSARASSGYGMTEASGAITSIAGAFFAAKPTSCGRILPTFDYRIVDDDGCDVTSGMRGELWVRGASVIPGYLDTLGNAIEPLPGGWLHTGDIVTIDPEGFVHIVDRKKDIILRGGENVACVEIEAAIYELDAVAQCAVFGIPDARLGEAVAAAIYPHPGATLDPQVIAIHCATRLATFKVPARIWILDEPIPCNASGKLLKRDLARALLAGS